MSEMRPIRIIAVVHGARHLASFFDARPHRGQIDALHARIRREIDEAVSWAERSPFPGRATQVDDVYENQ